MTDVIVFCAVLVALAAFVASPLYGRQPRTRRCEPDERDALSSSAQAPPGPGPSPAEHPND